MNLRLYAKYRTPQGQATIREYWADVPRSQREISFQSDILLVEGDSCIFHWRASFTRIPNGAAVRLDSATLISLNPQGQCYLLREWWHREEQL